MADDGAVRSSSRAVVALLALVAALVPGPGARAQTVAPDLPVLPPGSPVFLPHESDWNPTDEWIFPTIVRAADHLPDPLATYYLYTSPHDAPGGIALFLSDSLDGPWTPYPQNPVIPKIDGVTHISSAHVLWSETEGRFLLYFHGENVHTRLATSPDGVTWTHEGIVIAAPPTAQAASYARVFELEIPRLGNTYTMLYTEERAGGVLRIRYATSDDAREWTTQPEVLVSASGIEGTRISSPTYLPWAGRHLVIYHGSSGNVHVTEVGEDFDREDHLGVLFDQDERAAAPTFHVEDDRFHMFYESGPRLSAAIRHTSTPLSNVGPLVTPHSGTVVTGYFSDVGPSSHHDDIYRLERAGLTTGCGDPTRFCPTDTITRAQMATFLSRALRLPLGPSTVTTFDDVRAGTNFTAHIEALRVAGLTNGCGGNSFCPDAPVTRQEMAAFLARALDLPPVAGSHFVDVAQGTSFTGYINAIYVAGITNGVGGGAYDPTGPVTRQQMASFLSRGFGLR